MLIWFAGTNQIAMESITITQITPPELQELIEVSVKRALGSQQLNGSVNAEADTYLSIDEVVPILKISKATIYSKCQRRELPYSKRGGRLYFSKNELNEYLKGGKRKSQSEIEEEAEDYVANKKRG